MNIFLDDERMPSDVTWVRLPQVEWTIVRDFYQFRKLIESLSEQPSIISFDHDLGFGNGLSDRLALTGYDCAKFYCDYAIPRNWHLPTYFVHSMNPVGRANIEAYLENFQDYLNLR